MALCNPFGCPNYDAGPLVQLERAVVDLLRQVVRVRPLDAARIAGDHLPLVTIDLADRRITVQGRAPGQLLEVISLAAQTPEDGYGESTKWAHDVQPGPQGAC